MKKILFTFLLITSCLYCFAIPSKRVPFTVTQSDGTSLTLILIGDESFHYLSTTDGVPVVENDGAYFYATVADGTISASSILAHDEALRSASEIEYIASANAKEDISTIWSSRIRKRNAARVRKSPVMTGNGRRGAPSKAANIYEGNKRGLVILVQFPDKKFKNGHTRAEYDDMFNKEGYSENDNTGSVHDYFYAQSYGKFNLGFDVIGPYTAAKSYSYYGQNDKDGNDMHVCELVKEICNAASEDIDFSRYDWNGDSEVEQVFFVYAGPGEHTGAGANYIWPHEWTLEEGVESGDATGPIFFGDYKINTYAMSCELVDRTSGLMDGIGTACHEFSHCLGLPDLYCTNNDDYAFGMHVYDLMCNGASNGPYACGESPCGYTAYERWVAGWLEPIELNEPCTVTNMPCLGDAPIAYIIYNDGNRNEYFFLENRQDTDPWYQYTYCHTGISGLLIYHVDYDKDAWEFNEVNFSHNHQHMAVVPASGGYGTRSKNNYDVERATLEKQLFPGSNNATNFTDNTHFYYGGKLFNKNTDGTYYLHKPITDIKEENGLISFNFMGGGKVYDLTGIKDAQEEDSAAEYFTLSGTRLSAPLTKGVYIMRRNGVNKKIISK